MGARAPFAVNEVVHRTRAPSTVDVEGVRLVGRVEVLIGEVALVRWMVSDETGTHWHQELELVPVADLETTEVVE